MIITLSGANSFLLVTNLRKLTTDFVKTYGNFGLERFNAEETDYTKLLDSVQALPFLADKRMVVIDSPAGNKQLVENIDAFLAAVNDQTDLILVEPKFDKRSVIYKTLKKVTDFQEQTELDEPRLASWLVAAATEQGGEISSSDARYLIGRIGSDQLRLSNELAKLISYQPKVDRDAIDLLTTQAPQSTVFELLDAAFAGNKRRAMQLYDEQRRQKVEPQAILALLSWQLHALAVVKMGGDKSVDEIARESKLNPFVVRKSVGLARSINVADLKELVAQTLKLDVRLKSEPINADDALRNLLISIPT